MKASVIGAGLAGCEAAWQLACRGIKVTLYEMKPYRKTPAHTLDTMAELVCSNSLRSDRLTNAVGLLKEEMRRLGSIILRIADETKVPAGGALAVDREAFSAKVDQAIRTHEKHHRGSMRDQGNPGLRRHHRHRAADQRCVQRNHRETGRAVHPAFL